MNLARILVAPAMCVGLALGLSACKPDKPNGTSNPPGEGGNAAADGGGGDDGAMGGGDSDGGGMSDGGSDDGGGDSVPTSCDAKVSDTPTALFEDRVLVRVPLNVELVEDNPAFATTFSSAGFVSACDATVKQMNVLKFANDKKKKLTVFADEFVNDYLAKSGYTNGSRDGNAIESDNEVHTVVEYPAAGGQPATKMYIAVTRKLDFIIVATYLASPDEFGLLRPSFEESAKKIFVVPAS